MGKQIYKFKKGDKVVLTPSAEMLSIINGETTTAYFMANENGRQTLLYMRSYIMRRAVQDNHMYKISSRSGAVYLLRDLIAEFRPVLKVPKELISLAEPQDLFWIDVKNERLTIYNPVD